MIYHLLYDRHAKFSASRGGAVVHNVANMMRFDSSSVVVCWGADGSWPYGQDRVLLIPALRFYSCVKAKRFLPVWAYAPLLRRVFRPLLLRLKKGDIVWCHHEPFIAASLQRPIQEKGAKLIYHVDGSLAGLAKSPVFRSFNPDAVIFVSEAIRQEALRLLPGMEHTHAIHNGADDSLFSPAPLGQNQDHAVPVVLYVGRLIPIKGVHVLVDAVRILQRRKVDVACKIVGSCFAEGKRGVPYVRRLINDSPSNVQFEDWCSGLEIAQKYQSADIVCCPSICEEGFGNVNIEAMACGIPVVASRVGGIPEIAAEGGIVLVNPNSAVELADALQGLIDDQGLRGRVATEGLRSFRQRFTWTVIYKQYQEIIDSLRAGTPKE